MPGVTGIELAQMIKERKKTAQIPIIFLTAYYNEDQHVLEVTAPGRWITCTSRSTRTSCARKLPFSPSCYRMQREIGDVQPRPDRGNR